MPHCWKSHFTAKMSLSVFTLSSAWGVWYYLHKHPSRSWERQRIQRQNYYDPRRWGRWFALWIAQTISKTCDNGRGKVVTVKIHEPISFILYQINDWYEFSQLLSISKAYFVPILNPKCHLFTIHCTFGQFIRFYIRYHTQTAYILMLNFFVDLL